jgi:hypothetical protein
MNDSSPARVVVRFAGPDLRPTAPETVAMVVKPDSEWQRLLTPEQYRIARGRGTEPAFCGGLVRIDFGSDAVTYPYASHDWRLSVASSDLGGLWRRR